jgi:hypothetical protein
MVDTSARSDRGLQGALAGLVRKRRLIPASQQAARTGDGLIVRFLGAAGIYPPMFDPIQGLRSTPPGGHTAGPDGLSAGKDALPLRIAVLAPLYPAPGTICVPGDPGYATYGLVQDLFALGHTVHVIAPDWIEQVAFYNGAYVHRVPQHPRLVTQGVQDDLVAELNYSHLVDMQVRRLVCNNTIQIVHAPAPGLEGLVTARGGEIPIVVGPWPAAPKLADRAVYSTAQVARQAMFDELLRCACGVIGDAQVQVAGGDGSHLEVARRFEEIYRDCIMAKSVTAVSPTIHSAATGQ